MIKFEYLICVFFVILSFNFWMSNINKLLKKAKLLNKKTLSYNCLILTTNIKASIRWNS